MPVRTVRAGPAGARSGGLRRSRRPAVRPRAALLLTACLIACAAVLPAGAEPPGATTPPPATALHAARDRPLLPAQRPSYLSVREPVPENVPDTSDPVRDAVGVYIGCTVTLITPDIVLTAGHCVPESLRTVDTSRARGDACPRLPQQSQLQGNGWEEPLDWYPLAGKDTVRFGNLSDAPFWEVRPIAYASPRCADMALLRLDDPVPPDIAVPLPVLTEAGPRRGLPPGRPLRHAGWGGYADDSPPSALRGTGPVEYWGENSCVIVAIPPLRTDGKRLASGDSGAPLLMTGGDGKEIVAGVLFVVGQPDREVCGAIHPMPRLQHGSWTPTYRSGIRGTLATPIGAWLRAMVPQADHRNGP